MDTNIIRSFLLKADPRDPSVDHGTVDDPVQTAGVGEETKKFDKLISFVVLLEKHGCLKKCDKEYVISLTASKSWQPLFKYTQSVGSLELNRDAVLEAGQISPSVFVYIAQQLKGKPLFPNLSTIQLEGLDTSSHYLPLLGSTCLKDITLKLVFGNSFLEFAVYAFLENLVSVSPGLQSLTLQNVTRMASQMLNAIINFQHLHTLEIKRFTDVQNFEELRALGSLASLEYLSLTVKHLTYTRATQPASLDMFLPSLKGLRIETSLDVVSDFILFITSNCLEKFTFYHISTGAVDLVKPVPKGKKKSNPPSSTEGDTVKEQVNLLDNLSSRWSQPLEEVAIISSSGFKCDLRHVARLQALRNLEFRSSSIMGVQETFDGPYGFRNSLQSLNLSGFHVSLSLLRTIALSTPFLRNMALSFDIDERHAAPSAPAIIHPLQSLTINGGHRNEDLDSPRYYEITLSQSILLARYLNALFPDIQTLTASVRENEWEKVWQLLKFCQASRDDEKNRKSIGDCVDAT